MCGFEGGGFLYADDTVLYCIGRDVECLEVSMNRNLCKLEEWCSANMLTINSKKTKYMLFHNSPNVYGKTELNLEICGSSLNRVNFYDYLGVRLDDTSTYSQHIQKVINGCNQRIFTLSKIRKYITEETAVLIYKTLIMSKLNYGGIFCLSANTNQLSKLQKLQNRALRICFLSNRYISNLELHKRANVLPLCLRRKLDMCKLMFKRMLNAERVTGTITHTRPSTRYGVSRPPVFTHPKTSKFLRSVTYSAPLLWASLPNELKVLNDPGKFNSAVRKLVQAEIETLSRI